MHTLSLSLPHLHSPLQNPLAAAHSLSHTPCDLARRQSLFTTHSHSLSHLQTPFAARALAFADLHALAHMYAHTHTHMLSLSFSL